MSVNTKANPFFSVLIPVYNVEEYLKECVDSVIHQTEKDYEIILVDDGSEDKSPAICDDYAAQYDFIRVLHKQNDGLFMARYDAVKMSRGDYLMFLDSDDFYYPTALQKVRRKIEACGADMVIFDYDRSLLNGKIKRFTEPYAADTVFEDNGKSQVYFDFAVTNRFVTIWRKCIHRDIYPINMDFSQYHGLNHLEDKLISMFLLDRAQRIAYLKEALYRYRTNVNSITHNFTLKNYIDTQVVNAEAARYMKKWGVTNSANKVQQKCKMQYSVGCIASLARRIPQGKSTQEDLAYAVNYLREEDGYKEAFSACKNLLSLHQRIACHLILNGSMGELLAFMKVYNALKKVKAAFFQR